MRDDFALHLEGCKEGARLLALAPGPRAASLLLQYAEPDVVERVLALSDLDGQNREDSLAALEGLYRAGSEKMRNLPALSFAWIASRKLLLRDPSLEDQVSAFASHAFGPLCPDFFALKKECSFASAALAQAQLLFRRKAADAPLEPERMFFAERSAAAALLAVREDEEQEEVMARLRWKSAAACNAETFPAFAFLRAVRALVFEPLFGNENVSRVLNLAFDVSLFDPKLVEAALVEVEPLAKVLGKSGAFVFAKQSVTTQVGKRWKKHFAMTPAKMESWRRNGFKSSHASCALK